jgi:hypothetical protein
MKIQINLTPDYSYKRKEATISNAPYGLIAVKVGNEGIFVNAHGIFGKDGKHISTKQAKQILGLA